MKGHAIQIIRSSRRLALCSTKHRHHAICSANVSLKSIIKIHRRSNCTLSSSYTSTATVADKSSHHNVMPRSHELSAPLINNSRQFNTCHHHTHNLHKQQLQFFSTFQKSEYIHPLSQIVLEHLQTVHSDWVERNGLETGLILNKDGTFVLRFDGGGGGANTNNGNDGVGNDAKGSDNVDVDAETVDSIWTTYEPNEKKHYLCLCKNKLVGRYLLQDNTKPAWHTDKRSLPERVQDAVDEMVMKVDEIV